MSSTRVVLSSTVMVLAVSLGVWVITDTWPLTHAVAAQDVPPSIGPLERQAKPITPENPVPRRAYSVAPWYPGDLLGARGTVSLVITIDQFGRVGEVRRLGVRFDGSSDLDASTVQARYDALARAATDAVRQWQYDAPADGPIALQVSFLFEPDAEANMVKHAPRSPSVSAGVPSPQAPGTEARLRFSRDRGIELADGPLTWPANAVRVGGVIRVPTKVKDVRPVYPPEAKTAAVQGVVIIEALLGTDGRVDEARVLRSIPLLDRAALDAVSQWEFTPTLLNDQPTAVLMTVPVQFSLA
jgi:protein TonB